mgnify:CR=1 FL=1
MIQWRNIKDVGYPTNSNKSYLVTDGKEISTSNIYTTNKTFMGWAGDENTYEDNQCCSGIPMFDLIPTHWCPTDEINLP